MSSTQLDQLVTAVSGSSKYKQISPDLIRTIGSAELEKRPSFKAAIKATKKKLHQVGGAYLDGAPNYAKALTMLAEAQGDDYALRAACRETMRWHISTRERLPILDEFYTAVFAALPPINSVLDIACGLNPLARPWMALSNTAVYTAYDIYADAMQFLQSFMALADINGRAEVRDVLHNPPTQPADLVFILKTLPCLEQIDKQASQRLLDALDARYLLISYPVASLGGREKGMVAAYHAHFQALAAGRRWRTQRFLFDTELAFLVEVA